MEKLLDAVEVAALLGLKSPKTARAYIHEMAHIKLPGGDIRVEQRELECWLNARREADTPKKGRQPRRREPRVYDLELFEPDGRIKRTPPAKRRA